MNLGTIIAALHDSEINGEVSWFFDGTWRVKLRRSHQRVCRRGGRRQRRGDGRMVARERGETLSAQPVRDHVSPVSERSLNGYRGCQ